MKRNITKQLCLCVAVFKLLTALLALKLAPPEKEISKHMGLMQYQFKVFKNVNCLISLRRRHLDKAGTLFHNSTMLEHKCRLLSVSNHPH